MTNTDITSKDNIIPIASRLVHGKPTKTVHARKLHKFLGVGRDYSTWIKSRIFQYNFAEGDDYILVHQNGGTKGRGGDTRSIDHYLTLDMAKEMAMVEKTPKGKEVRDYFIACEKQLNKNDLPESIKQFAFAKAMEQGSLAAEASYKQTITKAKECSALSETEILREIDRDYVYGVHPVPEVMFQGMSAAITIFNKGLEVG